MIDHPSKRRVSNPFEKRKVWWTEPGAIVFLIVFILLGAVVEYYVSLLNYANVLIIFGVFWVITTVVILRMYKRVLYEPGVSVNEQTIERTRNHLHANRKQVQRKFKQSEVEVLELGEQTPVLDVWKLDPKYRSLHPYFSRIELTEIDPTVKEFRCRIQLGEIGRGLLDPQRLEQKLFGEVLRFFQLVSQDEPFVLYRNYFDTLVVEFYSLQENEEGRDVPYAFLSLLLKKADLPKIVSIGQATLLKFQRMCDVRYESGNPITPHRGLFPEAARGGK